jgi:hypothetical protein
MSFNASTSSPSPVFRRRWGTAIIRIRVDGSEHMVKGVYAAVRAAVKAKDPVQIVGKQVIVELSDRAAADAARAISYRLRERLSDFDVDIEVEDD